MDWSTLTDALTNGASSLIGTATTFGQGAIASSISGNPLYSNDPAAAGYAQAGTAAATAGVGSGGSGNLLVIALIGFLIYKLAK